MTMKKSRTVPLILLGTLALAACGQAEPQMNTRQNQYASADDCRKDWGADSRDCKQSSSGGGYVGPHYMWNHGAGHPVAIDPATGQQRALTNSYLTRPGAVSTARSATTSSFSRAGASRGGFGSSGRSFSAGG